jgi:hypothetical protein
MNLINLFPAFLIFRILLIDLSHIDQTPARQE